MSDLNDLDEIPVQIKRWGRDQPLPERRSLRAGPISLVLEGADLRYVTVNGVEIVRRLYMAVRDRNWGTIAPRYTRFDVKAETDSFHIEFDADHISTDVDFAWSGSIVGTADGRIDYIMDGAPLRPFYRNRIGFCVLHPMELAGQVARVRTPDGERDALFPDFISPNQPFLDMTSITYDAGPGLQCTIAFDGDLFETEDQRNWTDASYKTYGTPLRLKYPVEVTPNEAIRQSIAISLSGDVVPVAVATGSMRVVVGTTGEGTLPPIGFAVSPEPGKLTAAATEQLKRLKPAQLWAAIDIQGDWRSAIAHATDQATSIGVKLELVVWGIDSSTEPQLSELVGQYGDSIARLGCFPPLMNPVVFPRGDLDTNRESVEIGHRVIANANATGRIAVGGGTRANFTELNRASQRLPLDLMEWATYTMNPQVHAFDNASIVETLDGQAATVRSAQAVCGEVPLHVGPITLLPRFNPNATGPTPDPGPNHLPANVDPRQLSLFAAGWTLGSLRRMDPSLASLTYFETVGWRGLIERESDLEKRHLFPAGPGQLFPVYHIFAVIADFGPADQLEIELSDSLAFDAIAMQSGNSYQLLIAELSGERATIEIELPVAGQWQLSVLDENSYRDAASNPSFWSASKREVETSDTGVLTLELLPCAIASLTLTQA